MKTHLQKKAKKSGVAEAVSHNMAGKKNRPIEDNRNIASVQAASTAAIPAAKTLQQKKNNTGLPDNLKSGIENLSGVSMDGVKVHYNSSRPAQLSAHAYAQGTDIHVAPGQEKHLPHEAWHVVQQAQGRVRPTKQLKSKVDINDDRTLEKEADTMGAKALQLKTNKAAPLQTLPGNNNQATAQCASFEDFDTYDEAKNYNKYSKALLDKQKDDPIDSHFKKKFDSEEQGNIYKVNKQHYKTEEIVSDLDGETYLYKQDTKTLAHIDHRFPKSKGGSNSHKNAAVIPAKTNIQKSNKLEIDKEPSSALEPYKLLGLTSAFESKKVGTFHDFSAEQRKEILDANRIHYGKVTSDEDGKTKLSRMDTTRIPHIDHELAKAEGGTNYYFNAEVLPASVNIKKSGKKGKQLDIDSEIGEMTLEEYYKKKEKGDLLGGSAIFKY